MDLIRSKRAVTVNSSVQPVQLTKDQKPEDTEELIRIFRCGGRVQQLKDEKGNKIGPYRVWKPNTNGPGLAMSRSIGDAVGTDLGVISDPVITEYHVNWDADLFMMCASDGVWDVMENDEVVRYLERYRYHCVRGTTTPPSEVPVTCSNATIAQMICEEARTRWYAIVEKEEVFIDDISCVVVEFMDAQNEVRVPQKAQRDPPTEDNSPKKESRGRKSNPA
jgi:serine/threonine protein phosphatase PrpC